MRLGRRATKEIAERLFEKQYGTARPGSSDIGERTHQTEGNNTTVPVRRDSTLKDSGSVAAGAAKSPR
jgi:hypothetical protein